GPFKVLERVRDVAYKLDLPEEQSRVHNTFHVSNLKKCHADEQLAIPLDGLHFDDKLHFIEEPVEIVDREVKRVHNTFHVSILKKCHADESLAVPLDGLHFDDKLHFVEEPVEIVDREVKRLKRSRIPLVKNYKHLDWITVRRDDDKLYKFKGGDIKRLRIQDTEDMLLLLVHGKLTNLTVDERFAFNVSLRMFIRSIVIQRLVEDLQLGVESYQKKLNLAKPDTYRLDL
nr:reverse transcriptase domain-containing protein [Tanacetum cinerariifolium]